MTSRNECMLSLTVQDKSGTDLLKKNKDKNSQHFQH